MIKTFTQNDLIRFLYHETTAEESKEINNALLCDAGLREQYASLAITVREVDNATVEPSSGVLLNILAYSRSKESVNHSS